MSFDSHKYARAFEHLACKIIEEELTESICASGITQKNERRRYRFYNLYKR